VRVPGYIYGARGIVQSVCGEHSDPSFLAFGIAAPTVRLYRVRFRMQDVWPEQTDASSDDVIEAEVYAPWLDQSDSPVGCDVHEQTALFNHNSSGSDCVVGDKDHSHSHSHSHSHGQGDHSHEARPLVEKRAADLEGGPKPGKELFQALLKILTEKGLVELNEVRQMAERLVMAGQDLTGATLVVKAWLDDAFKERLLTDAASAAAELGIATSNPNAPTILTVQENTPQVHNLVVCTLCSCYPSGLLGIAPSWYKAREYRARAVREPRQTLQEFGTVIPEHKRIRVHDSTADHRYLVLPEKPEGTEGWDENELKSLVTRDTMVGVSIPTVY
jgi:nitrile hydratase